MYEIIMQKFIENDETYIRVLFLGENGAHTFFSHVLCDDKFEKEADEIITELNEKNSIVTKEDVKRIYEIVNKRQKEINPVWNMVITDEIPTPESTQEKINTYKNMFV
jgi:hypothetical protein